jgi:hypothetical protein
VPVVSMFSCCPMPGSLVLPHPIWVAPAFWNNNVYFGGKIDYLKAFSFDPDAQRLSITYTSKSPEVSNRPSPTPSRVRERQHQWDCLDYSGRHIP